MTDDGSNQGSSPQVADTALSSSGRCVLDARGFRCPLPVLKAKSALRTLPPGSELEVLTTDVGARADFEVLCSLSGHELVECAVGEDQSRFVIRTAREAARE